MPESDVYRLDWETWVEKFKPFKNHLDNNASSDGYMYETFGAEVEFVLEHARRGHEQHVWTLSEEDGTTWIGEGYHIVNRLGYFITTVPWVEGIQYIVDEQRDEEEAFQIQVTVKKDTGFITEILVKKGAEEATPLNMDLPDYYDNGSRGWRVFLGEEYRIFLQEEDNETEDTSDDQSN